MDILEEINNVLKEEELNEGRMSKELIEFIRASVQELHDKAKEEFSNINVSDNDIDDLIVSAANQIHA